MAGKLGADVIVELKGLVPVRVLIDGEPVENVECAKVIFNPGEIAKLELTIFCRTFKTREDIVSLNSKQI